MALAAREARRFEAVSWRPTRWPATRATPSGKRAAVEAGGELRDLGGRVLAVAVEGADGGAAGEGDAAVDGGRLAGAGGVPDEADLGEARGEGEDAGGGVVVGAVVDVDDLVGGEGLAGGDDRLGDEVDVLGLVLQRHDDGEPGHSRSAAESAT